MSRCQRSAIAKFRSGTAPLRIETGRYTGEREEDRLCRVCDSGEVENELHAIIRCPAYCDIRAELYSAAVKADSNFMDFTDDIKLSFIFSRSIIVLATAKACHNILNKRGHLLCQQR